MKLGLFSKLALSVVVGTTVASLFAAGLGLYFGLERINYQWEPRVRVTSEIINQTATALVQSDQQDKVAEALAPYLKLAGVKTITLELFDSDEVVQLQTEMDQTAPGWFAELVGLEERTVIHTVYDFKQLPLGKVTIFLSPQPYANGLWDMLVRLINILALGGFVLLIVAISLMRKSLKPIVALTAATKAVSSGDYSIRLKTEGISPDILPAIMAFNEMAHKTDAVIKTLNDRQSFLSTIFTSSPIGIIQVDREGNPIFANTALLKFTGIESENFAGEQLFDRVYPQDLQKVRDHWHYVQASGCPDSVNFRYLDKNNSALWVTANTVTVRNAVGNITSFVSFITDVSKEVELHEKEQQVSSFYLTLSQLNASIIHTQSRDELFHVICEIFKDQGGFAQALVVAIEKYIGKDIVRARVVSQTSGNDVLQEMTDIELSRERGAKSLIGYSLLENKMLVSNDYYHDERFFIEFRQRLYDSGIRAVSTVPISCFGKTVAFLELFSSEVGFFTDEIIEHIVQLGENISHAITNIEREQQRKNALTLAQHSQQRLDTTLRSIGDAVLVTDQFGNITMMNPAAEKITGWLEQEAYSQKAADLIKIYDLETNNIVESPIAKVLSSGELVGLDHRSAVVAKNGHKVPILTSGAPIRNSEGGQIEGAILVFKDQSKEYQTQKALKESEQRYATLVRTLPVGIIVLEVEGDAVYYNSELNRLIGFDKEHLTLQDLESTIHPDDYPNLRKYILDSVKSRKTTTTDYYRYLHADGSIVWAKMRFTPTFNEQGKYTGIVGGVLDVTAERHHLLQVQTLSTMYATLSRINYLVTQAINDKDLLVSVCKTVSEVSNFDYVAFYKFDGAKEKLIQSTRSGVSDFNETVLLEVANSDLSVEGLVVSVGNEMGSVVINDASSDKRLPLKWRLLAKNSGFKSVTLTPIFVNQMMEGVIIILSRSRDLFRPNVVELLDEIGDVVSFALVKLEAAEQKRLAEEALSRNEERLRLGLTATHTGMLEINYVTQKILLDKTCVSLLKLTDTSGEYDVEKLKNIFHDASIQKFQQVFEKDNLLRSNEKTVVYDFPFEEKNKPADGRWLRISGAITAERTSRGNPIRLIGFLSDITEEKLQASRNKLAATVFQNSRESILMLDNDNQVLLVNEAFCENYGYRREDIINKPANCLQSEKHDAHFYQQIQQSIKETGSWQGEWWRKRKNGDEYPALVIISLVRDVNGRTYHTVIQEIDISERKEAERRISTLAYHDSLTSLPNRSLLRDRVEQAIVNADRERHTLAILFLDLDHFKNINDSLGHSFGDRLLQDVAQRLLNSVRKSDTVGRLGGDEFLILLPEACADAAAHVAHNIIEECMLPCMLDDHALSVTPSIGVAMYPRDGSDYDELLKKADTAMYRAKDEGRNGFRFFTPEMNQAVFERMMLESSLRKAIEKQEFLLHYQPKFCIDTMELVGVEALLRWCQPEMGMVSPGQFIPIAEDTGLITEIGQWVLEEACQQAKRWLDQHSFAVKVAVNFSARQFAARSVEATVTQVLEKTQLPGELLEIEITESLLAQDMDYTYRALTALKEQGISISVDDFGTGYSSLSYLKRFPIDRLKIDQSFVRDLEKDQDDRAIAAAIVTMGHSLGIQVIAEGIETQEQMQILRLMSCDEGQGYYLGRPMPAEEITNLLDKPAMSPDLHSQEM